MKYRNILIPTRNKWIISCFMSFLKIFFFLDKTLGPNSVLILFKKSKRMDILQKHASLTKTSVLVSYHYIYGIDSSRLHFSATNRVYIVQWKRSVSPSNFFDNANKLILRTSVILTMECSLLVDAWWKLGLTIYRRSDSKYSEAVDR